MARRKNVQPSAVAGVSAEFKRVYRRGPQSSATPDGSQVAVRQDRAGDDTGHADEAVAKLCWAQTAAGGCWK